jgi:exodeoxyribonuclease VII small subunit
MTKSKTKELDFEAAMAELESLVERMESGDLPLEETLKQFERGVILTRQCQEALKQAEQKVQILSGNDDNALPEDFAPTEE